jgi:hypothetical protein
MIEIKVGQIWKKFSNSDIHFHITRKETVPILGEKSINYYYVNIVVNGQVLNETGFEESMLRNLAFYYCLEVERKLEIIDKIVSE